MLDDGAAIVDVGGESTRPGSAGVAADEELRRIEPVLEARRRALSRSTRRRPIVARRALELGAELVNDVTALRGDDALAETVAELGAYVCLMHMRGEPRTMQDDPRYDDVVSEVKAFLEERLAAAVAAGIPEQHVCLDPGIGFGKTVAHNFELVRRLDELVALGRPILIGFSRKSSLGRILGDPAARTGPLAASRRRRGGGVRARRDDPARARRARARRGARRGEGGLRVKVELHGLQLFGYHGVEDEEQRLGQLFLYDVELEVGERGVDDRIEDAVDYRHVAAAVREVNERRFKLLEALATAVADTRRRALPGRAGARPRAEAAGEAGRVDRRVRGRHRRAPVTLAYVGLGANLGDREATIRRGRRPARGATPVDPDRDRALGRRRPAPVPQRRRGGRDGPRRARAARAAAGGRARPRPGARRLEVGAADDRPRPAGPTARRASTSRD